MTNLTLPTDSNARKQIPLFAGFLRYFPAAIAGAAFHAKKGNDKHNPGQDLHWSRWNSGDHGDCILRHLMDLADLMAAREREVLTPLGETVSDRAILDEADALVWRACALSQELHEKYAGAPVAPAARTKEEPKVPSVLAANPAFVASVNKDVLRKFRESYPYQARTTDEVEDYIASLNRGWKG